MMKQSLALLALAALISSMTVGEAAAKKKTVRAKPAPVTQQGRALGYASGAMYRRAHSPNPRWDVYWANGRYAGSDPDPLIRDMLRRDTKVSSGDDE